MNQEEIQAKLNEASALYNDGRYDEAIALWQGVLQVDPENVRAREGMQMVRLLTSDWDDDASGSASSGPDEPGVTAEPGAPDAKSPIDEGLERVLELLEAGDLDADREGVEVLLQLAPDHPGVVSCAARLEGARDPASYVAEQLSLARHYLMMEGRAEASEACRRALAVDPDSDEAKELLSQAQGGSGDPTGEPAAPPPAPPAAPVDAGGMPPAVDGDLALGDDDLLSFDLDDLGDEPVPELGVPVPASQEQPSADAAPPLDPDSPEAKVRVLLTQGDQHESEGRLQDAIDTWSRIFILDDNHAEAEARIDQARRTLEEQALRVDEMRFKGEDLLKSGDLEGARGEYRKILDILPNHLEARNSLEEIEQRIAAGEKETEGDEIESVPLASPAPSPPQEPLEEEIEEPQLVAQPRPPSPPPVAAMKVPVPRRSGGARLPILAVVVVGLIVLGFGGYMGWKILFPAGPSADLKPLQPRALDRTSPAPSAAAADGDDGGDPAGEPAAIAETEPAVSAENAATRAREFIDQGSRLFEAGSHAEALDRFQQALALNPADMQAKDWETRALAEVRRVEAFGREIAIIRSAFEDFDFASALKKLYRVEPPGEAERAMVERWTAVCWYDWGVFRLQAGKLGEAEEKFQEVLEFRPNDPEVRSHLEVVERYRGQLLDDTFQAYADRVALRPLDGDS